MTMQKRDGHGKPKKKAKALPVEDLLRRKGKSGAPKPCIRFFPSGSRPRQVAVAAQVLAVAFRCYG